MPKLVQQLNLVGNPFQYYTAETEPNISKYAIKPPYMESITHRALNSTSFVLFGDRGAGKSATRITVFEELWKRKGEEAETKLKVPLAVNFTDYHTVIAAVEGKKNVEQAFIEQVAFLTVEQILAWLASLSIEDRNDYIDGMTQDEMALSIDMLRLFYFNRPEIERRLNSEQALKVLNQAWKTRSALWASQKWNELVSLAAKTGEAIVNFRTGKDTGIAKPIEDVLKSKEIGPATISRVTLQKIVEFARIFSFSGVVMLIDKVDETAFTQNSAEKTSALIYPILSHVQLLEVDGFSWMFFLWSKVKHYLEAGDKQVRLDKIAHTTISWDIAYFEQMLNERIKYFSNDAHLFHDLFTADDFHKSRNEIIETAMRSPRELIRLLDTIVTEHDILYAEEDCETLLDDKSIEVGLDRYVKDTVNTIFDEKMLTQVYRLKGVKFTNKDVQGIFRIKSNSARNKIRTWEEVGIAKQTGTTAAEGDLGGKPSYEFTVVDSRVARVVARNLVEVDEEDDMAQEDGDA